LLARKRKSHTPGSEKTVSNPHCDAGKWILGSSSPRIGRVGAGGWLLAWSERAMEALMERMPLPPPLLANIIMLLMQDGFSGHSPVTGCGGWRYPSCHPSGIFSAIQQPASLCTYGSSTAQGQTTVPSAHRTAGCIYCKSYTPHTSQEGTYTANNFSDIINKPVQHTYAQHRAESGQSSCTRLG
jgi:hypothetical protein